MAAQSATGSWREDSGGGGGEEADNDGLGYALDAKALVGTCQALEKPFFRLTAAPDPTRVRPPRVLEQALAHIKSRWSERNDYEWTADQLKAVRQDLVVQHIRTVLTLQVYADHARIALEYGDLNNYAQCAVKVAELTSGPLRLTKSGTDMGKQEFAQVRAQHMDEFTGYRLLNAFYRNNHTEIGMIMLSLTAVQRAKKVTKHALEVLSACNLQNYDAFFRLYGSAPNMSGYIMDFLLTRQRCAAWRMMVKAYSPTLPLSFVQFTLAFSDESSCEEFVESVRGGLRPPEEGKPRLIDTHESRLCI
mmetsp:Transcript_31442/g.83169  ORF Transcript_31442/g.83169 Transcript_31442/m.83169 type:complete len:305 (-) Transcript_31442:10-924(-)